MNEQTYNLLITVLGGLIPGLLGIINTIITLRAKRGQRVVSQRINQAKSEPTEPISRKGRPRMLLFVVLVAVGAAIGFYIGNVTKKSPYVVRHYSQEEQRSISRERIADIERRIHEIERERERILQQPTLPEPERERRIHEIERERERILQQPTLAEPEREAMIQSYNERIDQLTMKKAEFKEIARQVEIP